MAEDTAAPKYDLMLMYRQASVCFQTFPFCSHWPELQGMRLPHLELHSDSSQPVHLRPESFLHV